MKSNNNITTFEEHLTKQYGKIGSEKRTEFEGIAKSFVIDELLKEERLGANLTKEKLAYKIGAKKRYIPRVGNGKSEIHISTLFRFFEFGLAKCKNLTLE